MAGRRRSLGVMTSIEKSPDWKKRAAKRTRRQNKEWAAKSGPVTVRRVGDDSNDRSA